MANVVTNWFSPAGNDVMTMPTRTALSLVEIIISMAIFATFLVAALESMSGMRNFTSTHERVEDLENESKRILRTVTNDFANSAWFFQMTAVNTSQPRFPVVFKQADTGAYADAIEFVKLRTERSLNTDATDLRVEHVNFANPADRPVPFSSYHQAKPVYSLVLNERYLDPKLPGDATTWMNDVYVSAVWESAQPAQTFSDNADPAKIRVYRYEVQLSPDTGYGRLVRLYRNSATAPWTEAEVLSENVLEFEVDRFDTRPGLNMNQIGFRLVLERRDAGNAARARRVVETTVAMRSITNDRSN